MPVSDPFEILLAHDRWATQQILLACEKLTHEQFHKPFEMGPGSLHATTTHILSAQRLWADVLSGQPSTARMDQSGKEFTPAELLKLHEEIAEGFAKEAHGHPVDEMVHRERGGKTYSFTRGAVITHVMTHGTHHRAQCLNMLRHLGVAPLPKSSVLEWMITVDNPQ
jgi:uncharacterized damage-inducible protein DinB